MPELKNLPVHVDIKKEPLKSKIEAFQSKFYALPFKYHTHVILRICLIITVILGLLVLHLYCQGHLKSFTQDFSHFVKQINWKWVALGVACFSFLSLGAFYVIHRVLQLKDPITQQSIGKLSGDDHWLAAIYTREDSDHNFPGYIDTSTLTVDENGKKSGQAFMYSYKACNEAYTISCVVIGATPLHALAAMVYNLVRLVVIPFYILGAIAVEKKRGKPLFEERFFSFKDIPNEMAKSIFRAIKAPFYATAICFAALYAIVDSLNGRKLGAYIERDWNEGVTRTEGFWSVRGWQPLWRFEGGLGPDGLGRNGFYLAGCWQPVAVVYFKEGVLQKEADSLSKAIKPGSGKSYTMHTKEILMQAYHEMFKELERQGSPQEVVAS